ncbi:hypothetical protein BO94DRAFT_481446 [Aspergillus sclerotioniger CBS 115572]|uniref:DNA replication checkpoint mediator MRC1 domain-containing protein n=1 Tax=Aspergillus sclerotioniger CBS 115572 TaxID=1450535 RepID=A0A317XD60_9EURO|nr:hypothetical protein BO94DRAFT_481446 [Aspergillus sclerotioniger CBS 115572]PWY96554.1 hypothetical protein BO94DRAFT_481446 [Aspergillus sclerotioniger CBS 115572]
MSSTPSTPRTTRTASRANSPEMLTPGRKIKAMLAAFDSDSDVDNEVTTSKPDRSTTTLSNALKNSTISTRPTTTLESDGDDDEDDIVMPKGRMAARLQAQAQNQNSSASTPGQTAFERVSKTLRTEKQDADRDAVMDDADDSNDDLPAAGPGRRGRKAVASMNPRIEQNESDRSPSPARSDSPLFVSSPMRERDDAESQAGSGDDIAQPKANSRFLALVAQKRKEREEKEKAEAEKRAARAKQHEQFSSQIHSGSESEGENGSGRKLTQQARPARKASKKALEEMNRETQRMSRNMQLAHQAQTKKKITKESFFARFKSKQSVEQTVPGPSGENSSTTAGSLNSSDVEAQKDKETPRTSPVLGPAGKASGQDISKETEIAEIEEFPTLEEILANPRPQPEQPVVVRMEIDEATTQPEKVSSKKTRRELTVPPVRVRLTREEVARQQKDDSDSELEIVTSPAKARRIAAFENVPARKVQESASLIKLKALAHLTSPTRKSTMNPAQLSATVLFKARQQAAKERQDRIQELRAKGVHIETAEERAAMEDELENLVEKARKEAEDIAKMERKAFKGNDEDDDNDWDYSGSEEEADEENENEDEEENAESKPAAEQGLIDSEAGESDESEDDQTEVMSVDEDVPTQRRKRPTRTVIDDDDDDDDETEPKTPAKSVVTPTTRSVERPHLPTQSSSNLMSLTQAFAGTIAGSHQDNEGGSSTIPHSLPEPGLDRQESDSQMIIKDSQESRTESADLLAGYAQSDARISESPAPRSTQPSQVPDPTQDAGFVFSPFDPSKRFLGTPQSTIETVVVNRDDHDSSPAPSRRMKQLKRGRIADLSMIEEQEEGEGEGRGDFEIDASVFNIMKKVSKKPAVPFDRNKSKAKDIVEEAAEESDDEYAGLGGASDEDEDAENAYDRQMINDNSGETVDEKQLAALNALHQRNADEKQVAKLLKDITTGALRRRRNADDEFDLDDSDDELLARRREKQREFARMRKALLADEKIGEIAENPKKAAFFRAVEDRDDDDDDIGFEFLDDEQQQQDSTQTDDQPSQDTAAPQPRPNTTTTAINTRKRPLEPTSEETYNRPPPHLRRKPASAMSKKPATLAEIRETLSFLTETHDYDSFHEDASMEDAPDHDEDEDEDSRTPEFEQDPDQQEQILPPSQRLHPRRTRGPVVDRLALLRQASSNSATSASNSTGNRLAFHSGSGSADGTGFTRPPLLRKTTTGSTSSATSSTISSRAKSRQSSTTSSVSTGGGSGSAGAGGKKGAVNYYTAAREQERERQLRMKERGSNGGRISALLDKHAKNRLGELGGKGQWE